MNYIKEFSKSALAFVKGEKTLAKKVDTLIRHLNSDPHKTIDKKFIGGRRWFVKIEELGELEIITEEGSAVNAEELLYLGLNLCDVPLGEVAKTLVKALELADGLVGGVKISLVGPTLVASISIFSEQLEGEELDYYYKLLRDQSLWLRDQLKTQNTDQTKQLQE
ncbi:MAG TPA: hypothetical protein PKD37_02660 [Oligoflexia bacterium]|nr:hypothetical protein [Oligoflexia bacterium]HMP26872.1 hypothetical protein [Oligoflexia bacterium]